MADRAAAGYRGDAGGGDPGHSRAGPLDAVLAWPLVLADRWMAGSDAGPLGRLGVGLLGIVLTWIYYVLLARLLVRWTAHRAPDL